MTPDSAPFFAIIFVILAACAFFAVAILPGRIARNRHHPHAQAVALASWLALIFCCVLWPAVLVWAYVSPGARQS